MWKKARKFPSSHAYISAAVMCPERSCCICTPETVFVLYLCGVESELHIWAPPLNGASQLLKQSKQARISGRSHLNIDLVTGNSVFKTNLLNTIHRFSAVESEWLWEKKSVMAWFFFLNIVAIKDIFIHTNIHLYFFCVWYEVKVSLTKVKSWVS